MHTLDDNVPAMANSRKYARIIVQLMYTTLTQVDCVYAVNTLTKYISNPQTKHYNAAQRINQSMWLHR